MILCDTISIIMAAHIVVKDLSKYYGSKVAVRKLNFEINPGEIVGFLGPNGAGKSTTLRILCGLLPASEGYAYINDLSLTTHIQQIKTFLGYMPENNPLPEDMRVEEFLRFRAHLKQVKNVSQSVGEVMERCDLTRTAAHKIIRTLSKGFKQRVGIADALLGKPQLIILDEPTIGLDPHQILGIRDILKQLRGETTVIFSSHILPEVEAACSKLLIIHQGELVANGTSQSLRERYFPQKRYTLKLKDSNGNLWEDLKNADFNVRCVNQKGDTFVFESLEAKEDFETAFLQWLFLHNYKVQQFFKIEPTLEMLFLKLTKFSWKETTIL